MEKFEAKKPRLRDWVKYKLDTKVTTGDLNNMLRDRVEVAELGTSQESLGGKQNVNAGITTNIWGNT